MQELDAVILIGGEAAIARASPTSFVEGCVEGARCKFGSGRIGSKLRSRIRGFHGVEDPPHAPGKRPSAAVLQECDPRARQAEVEAFHRRRAKKLAQLKALQRGHGVTGARNREYNQVGNRSLCPKLTEELEAKGLGEDARLSFEARFLRSNVDAELVCAFEHFAGWCNNVQHQVPKFAYPPYIHTYIYIYTHTHTHWAQIACQEHCCACGL